MNDTEKLIPLLAARYGVKIQRVEFWRYEEDGTLVVLADNGIAGVQKIRFEPMAIALTLKELERLEHANGEPALEGVVLDALQPQEVRREPAGPEKRAKKKGK